MAYRILAINPGSTSTKIAIFEDENQIFIKTIRHSAEEISSYPNIASQFAYRKDLILSELKNARDRYCDHRCNRWPEAVLSNRSNPAYTK